MSDKQDDAGPNSLGLDLQSLSIDDTAKNQTTPDAEPTPSDGGVEEDTPSADQADNDASPEDEKSKADGKRPVTKERKTPYVNPDRVKTGGTQREKLTDEELKERMVRIREQNEKIKLRREDVKKDEDEFKKMQDKEREKQAKAKKVQEHINRTREQNAKRKLDKISNREWDSEKKGNQWKDFKVSQNNGEGDANRPPPASIDIRGAIRGGGPGRGRGRGRGRGGHGPSSDRPSGSTEPKSPQSATASENSPAPAPVPAPAPDTPTQESNAETVIAL
ncbi:hypothetical protein QCA50_007879 [Cerrena zonata]|uniref:Uncharacterized protein n=1 Tax=Cerrena zonata TaxID=2478898 RepID=A0AAW0G735_9APHY